MLKNKKVLLAWVVALIILFGTIAFVIIYKVNGNSTGNKYKNLENNIWNLITDKNFKNEHFSQKVISGIHSSLSNFTKGDEVKAFRVLYESANSGHVGFIFEYINKATNTPITHIFDLIYNEKGVVFDFLKVF